MSTTAMRACRSSVPSRHVRTSVLPRRGGAAAAAGAGEAFSDVFTSSLELVLAPVLAAAFCNPFGAALAFAFATGFAAVFAAGFAPVFATGFAAALVAAFAGFFGGVFSAADA